MGLGIWRGDVGWASSCGAFEAGRLTLGGDARLLRVQSETRLRCKLRCTTGQRPFGGDDAILTIFITLPPSKNRNIYTLEFVPVRIDELNSEEVDVIWNHLFYIAD